MRINTFIIATFIVLLSTKAYSQDSYVKNNSSHTFSSYQAQKSQKKDMKFWKKMGMLFGIQAGYSFSYWENNISFEPEFMTDLNYTFSNHILDVNIATPIIGYKNKWAVDNFSNSEGKMEYKFTELNMWGLANLSNYLTQKNNKDYMGLNAILMLSPIYQKHEVKSATYNLEKTQVGFLFNLFVYSNQKEHFNNKQLTLFDENGNNFEINSDLAIERTTIGLSTLEFFRTIVDWYSYVVAHELISGNRMKYVTTLFPYPAVNYFWDKSKYIYGDRNDIRKLELEGTNYELGLGWSPALYFPRKNPKAIIMGNFSYYPWGGTSHQLKVNDGYEFNTIRKTDALSCKISVLINL